MDRDKTQSECHRIALRVAQREEREILQLNKEFAARDLNYIDVTDLAVRRMKCKARFEIALEIARLIDSGDTVINDI